MQKNIVRVLFLVGIISPWINVEGSQRSSDDYDSEEEESSGTYPGIPARRGAFPNIGALIYDGRNICGCTLIDGNHALTGASCLSFLKKSDSPKLSVYFNTVALKTYNPGAVISKVINFKIHDNYDKVTKVNDLAILSLDTNVTTLYPLSLPADGTLDDFTGKNATILRWRPSNKEGNAAQEILMQASVLIISNELCEEKYGSIISEKSMCAFNDSVAEVPCKEEGNGGPIIVDGRQVGIMSWGKGCMDSYYPGVYTRIIPYQDWIKLNTLYI